MEGHEVKRRSQQSLCVKEGLQETRSGESSEFPQSIGKDFVW